MNVGLAMLLNVLWCTSKYKCESNISKGTQNMCNVPKLTKKGQISQAYRFFLVVMMLPFSVQYN